MDEAAHDPSSEELKARAARKRVLNKYVLKPTDGSSGFADPAQMFS